LSRKDSFPKTFSFKVVSKKTEHMNLLLLFAQDKWDEKLRGRSWFL
jgi:hypothetical protein